MDPIVLNQLAQINARRQQRPGVPVSKLLEFMKLEKERTDAQAGSNAALERLEGLGKEERGVYGEIQTELGDTPTYKRPEREGVSKGSINFGLLLGGIGALTGYRDPASLTGTVIGGQKALKEQAYSDKMDTLRERMELDRQGKLDRVAGLQAKLGGIGSEKEIAGLEQSVKSGEASRIGSELFQREQSYQQQANYDKEYAEGVRRFGLTYQLSINADKRAEFERQMRENPYLGLDKQAQTLAPFFGGDAAKAKQALVSDLIVNQAQAQWMPKMLEQQFNLGETQAKEATESLKQLETKGKYLEAGLKQELASAYLSDQNTRQSMEARGLQIAEMRKAANAPQLPQTLADQLAEANGEVARWKAMEDKLLASGAKDTESLASLQGLIGEARAKQRYWKGKANEVRPGTYGSGN